MTELVNNPAVMEPLPPHPASPAYYRKCERAAAKWRKLSKDYPGCAWAAGWWERERLRVLDILNANGWVDLEEDEDKDDDPAD